MKVRKVSQERHENRFVSSEQLVAEYQAGATGRDLAAKYGTSFQNIYIRLWNAGIVPHLHRRRSNTHRKQGSIHRSDRVVLPITELVQRYEAGETSKAIAATYNVRANTILKRLRRAGVAIRTNTRKISDEQLRADYLDEGLSTLAIARKHGVAHSNVYRHLSKLGITRSQGWKLQRKKKS